MVRKANTKPDQEMIMRLKNYVILMLFDVHTRSCDDDVEHPSNTLGCSITFIQFMVTDLGHSFTSLEADDSRLSSVIAFKTPGSTVLSTRPRRRG